MNNKLLGKAVGIVAVVAIFVFALNYLTLQRPMSNILESDSRNNGVSVSVHYDAYVNTSELIFDLRKVSGSNSQTDIFRVFLLCADMLREKEFESVVLAYKGERKFQIDGAYFRDLGVGYETDNPVYTMRTFPENLYEMNGEAAFNTWTGGVIGVLQKQIEDFSAFSKKWYLIDVIVDY